MRNFLLFTFLSVLLSSCGPNYIYEEIHVITEEGWTHADTIDFSFSIDDTTALYNLYLELEHSTTYGSQNLYTQIYTRFPSGERKSQTISLELADKTGSWEGDCSSERCKFLAPIQVNAFFNEPGEYVFTLEQYMRESLVVGVLSVGFKVEDTGERR